MLKISLKIIETIVKIGYRKTRLPVPFSIKIKPRISLTVIQRISSAIPRCGRKSIPFSLEDLRNQRKKNVSGEDYVHNWKALVIHTCFWNCFTPSKGDKTNVLICQAHTSEKLSYSKNKESLK